jgi:hypothetical protein
LIAVLFFMPAKARAEFQFDVKTGYFIPSDDAFKDIYGSTGIVAGDLIYWFDEWGMSACLDYFSIDGSPLRENVPSYITSSSEIKRTNFSISGLYRFGPPKETYWYLGLGIDFAKFEEELKASTSRSNISLKGSVNGTGAHILAGIDMKVSKDVSAFLEGNVTSITFDGEEGASGSGANGGGVTIFAGIRF